MKVKLKRLSEFDIVNDYIHFKDGTSLDMNKEMKSSSGKVIEITLINNLISDNFVHHFRCGRWGWNINIIEDVVDWSGYNHNPLIDKNGIFKKFIFDKEMHEVING